MIMPAATVLLVSGSIRMKAPARSVLGEAIECKWPQQLEADDADVIHRQFGGFPSPQGADVVR